MSNFAKDGLLSEDLDSYIQKYQTEYKEWFDLCNMVNQEAQEAMLSIRAKQFDMEAVLVTTLFLRILETFQTVVILAERGILIQCRMLIRCMLDAVFPLVAISNDKDHSQYKNYIMQELFERKKRARKYGKLDDAKPTELKCLTDMIEEIERQIDEEGLIEQNRFYWADKAGLSNWYYTEYALTSMTVHSSIRDLEQSYLDIREGKFTELKWGPTEEGMSRLLISAIQLLIVAYSAVNKYYCTKKAFWVEEAQKQLDDLTTRNVTD